MSFVNRTVSSAMKWLVMACVPALLVACAGNVASGIRKEGGSIIVAGDARFEFLTPSLVRMEYSPSGAFVDAPTAVVQKRDWPAVAVQSSQKDGWLIAKTGTMTLRYRLQSGQFTAANLDVAWNAAGSGSARSWRPGEVDRRNLGGLTYSLDNISKPNLPADGMDLESPVNVVIPGIEVPLPKAKPGLLSRSGYAFIDDSTTPVWNARTDWIEPRRQTGNQDWYLFTYGRDYARVMREYAALSGPIPMIPRYTLGAWITDFNFEYFPGSAQSSQPAFRRYNEQHLKEVVSRLRENRIPLDVLVLDFAWHNYGWDGGFDWSPLVAHPEQLLDWMHDRGVKVSLNDHPGYANTEQAVVSHEDSHAPAALKALGRPLPPRPSFDMDVSQHWEFATDPDDEGLQRQWFAKERGARWMPVEPGMPWEAQGHAGYAGIAWYRTSVRLPAQLPDALCLVFGEVGGSYRLFVNGEEVAHSRVQWPQRVTYADVASYVKAGQANAVALRVEAGERGSGLIGSSIALRDVEPPPRIFFDLSDKQQAAASMEVLHKPLLDQGVAFWWVDGGNGAAGMPGLNPQLWTNKVFYDATRQATGKRGFILGRYGDWGSQRYPAYFTGDTYSEWPVLAYEVAYTARAGNVLVPYVSHDIGGFHGAKIDFDLYARWIEFGTFSPILRMHSAHANPREGNARMPWVYGEQGMALMKKYFTLRTRLIPYLYTYTWTAHKDSMPILRPLYLHYPDLDEAYRHPHEYFFGEQMLVAPVLEPSGNVTVYLPPGEWFDFFTGKRHHGGTTFTAHYAVDDTPVFVRDGGIVPEQPESAYSDARPLDRVILNVYGSGKGSFDLYEDDGVSVAYENGQYALTPMTYAATGDGTRRLVIGPTTGSFEGQVQKRTYELRIHGAGRPRSLSVNGSDAGDWTWNARQATATVVLPEQSARDTTRVEWLLE